ncbi:MAG: hypothetical protein AVDCRST_MAG02-3298, partial [uncultured Rubrobacteraceae bacterium]
DPGAGGQGVGCSQGGPGLQERLGRRAVRPRGAFPLELEPCRLGWLPGAARVLPGPPRRPAGARDAGRGEAGL